MKPFSKLKFNPLPEALLRNSPLTDEDQKSFSFIDIYAFLNPSIIDFLNLKYEKYLNELSRKIQLYNSKENIVLIIKSEIKDFEGDTNREMMYIFSSSVYETNRDLSIYLKTLKDNPHYVNSFSPEVLKGFVLLTQTGIISLNGVNLNVIDNSVENTFYDDDSIKDILQTINKEVLEVENTRDTLKNELFVNTSGLLEQYFVHKYIQHLEDELIQLDTTSVTHTGITWKGSNVSFAELVYSLFEAKLLTNEENEKVKLVKQLANLLGIELGSGWESSLSRKLADQNPRDQPKLIKELSDGYEKMRRSRMNNS